MLKVDKVPVPPAIEKLTKAWRLDFVPMPESYIEFHKNLAEKRIVVLKETFGFEILKSYMRTGGWFDGMHELNVIIQTQSERLRHLVWSDSNQDFMVRMERSGQGAAQEKDFT